MNLNKEYQNSKLKEALDFLFAPKIFFDFSETFFGKLLSNLKNEKISEYLLYLSLALTIFQLILPSRLEFLIPVTLITGILLSEKLKIKISKALVWFIIFIILSSLSAVFAIGDGLNPKMIFLGWLIWAEIGLFIVAGQTLGREKLYKLSVVLISIAGIYGISQVLSGSGSSSAGISVYENIAGRASSFVGNPNVFGVLSVIGLSCSLLLWLKEKKNIYIFSSLILFLAVILSFSRTAWLALVISALIFVLIKKRKYLLFAPIGLLLLLIPSVYQRVKVLTNPQYLNDSYLDGRIWAMINGLHVWKNHPLFGSGPGSYGGELAASYASLVYYQGIQQGYVALYFTDNQWLELLVQVGMLGLMAMFGFFISGIWQIIKNWKDTKNDFYLPALFTLVILIVSGFFANILEFGVVVAPAGLIIGSCLNES